MDEPTANLDPESLRTIRDFLLELEKEKKTVFLNTYNLDEAQKICDKIGILNTRLRATGTPSELEELVRGKKTVVQLVQVNEAVLNALKRLSVGRVARDNNRLTIDVTDPEKENPERHPQRTSVSPN